jgi:hypothetical protein
LDFSSCTTIYLIKLKYLDCDFSEADCNFFCSYCDFFKGYCDILTGYCDISAFEIEYDKFLNQKALLMISALGFAFLGAFGQPRLAPAGSPLNAITLRSLRQLLQSTARLLKNQQYALTEPIKKAPNHFSLAMVWCF